MYNVKSLVCFTSTICFIYMYIYIFFTLQSAPGLEQYAIKKFAESLEILPRAIAENAGAKVNDLDLLFKLSLIFLIHV